MIDVIQNHLDWFLDSSPTGSASNASIPTDSETYSLIPDNSINIPVILCDSRSIPRIPNTTLLILRIFS